MPPRFQGERRGPRCLDSLSSTRAGRPREERPAPLPLRQTRRPPGSLDFLSSGKAAPGYQEVRAQAQSPRPQGAQQAVPLPRRAGRAQNLDPPLPPPDCPPPKRGRPGGHRPQSPQPGPLPLTQAARSAAALAAEADAARSQGVADSRLGGAAGRGGRGDGDAQVALEVQMARKRKHFALLKAKGEQAAANAEAERIDEADGYKYKTQGGFESTWGETDGRRRWRESWGPDTDQGRELLAEAARKRSADAVHAQQPPRKMRRGDGGAAAELEHLHRGESGCELCGDRMPCGLRAHLQEVPHNACITCGVALPRSVQNAMGHIRGAKHRRAVQDVQDEEQRGGDPPAATGAPAETSPEERDDEQQAGDGGFDFDDGDQEGEEDEEDEEDDEEDDESTDSDGDPEQAGDVQECAELFGTVSQDACLTPPEVFTHAKHMCTRPDQPPKLWCKKYAYDPCPRPKEVLRRLKVAAAKKRKCRPAYDGLKTNWGKKARYSRFQDEPRHPYGRRLGKVWVNPPFSKTKIWVEKCLREVLKSDIEIMLLLRHRPGSLPRTGGNGGSEWLVNNQWFLNAFPNSHGCAKFHAVQEDVGKLIDYKLIHITPNAARASQQVRDWVALPASKGL
eukprot:TRINITY_DN19381_c0_g1_i1.p1 TRINITY_DN19381_c0_g1~~TRINITY_DN19381_c0_g1_i1.p1  ORF type:complete len:621 (+),score=88.40 TRINITY_DN19381_c0_g1_i1:112-1974(+)